ncbi:MAG: MaoC family dehydratase [Hyphomicrobium sp.]
MMSQGQFPPTQKDPVYEDFVVGEMVPFGRMTVTKDDIVRYARAFDPQAFHLSEETARDTNVGRLIASGYHTCCLMMRMAADDLLGGTNAMGSPGVDDVRFLKPVLPDDQLSARCKIIDKRELKSKPGVGVLHLQFEMLNTRDEIVMAWDLKAFRRMRAAAIAAGGAA